MTIIVMSEDEFSKLSDLNVQRASIMSAFAVRVQRARARRVFASLQRRQRTSRAEHDERLGHERHIHRIVSDAAVRHRPEVRHDDYSARAASGRRSQLDSYSDY